MAYVTNAFGESQSCGLDREYRGFYVWEVHFSFGPAEVTTMKALEDWRVVPGSQIGIRCVNDPKTVNRLIDEHIEENKLTLKNGVYSRAQEEGKSALPICIESILGEQFEVPDTDARDWVGNVNKCNDLLEKKGKPPLNVKVLNAEGVQKFLSKRSTDPYILATGVEPNASNELDLTVNADRIVLPGVPAYLAPHPYILSVEFPTKADFKEYVLKHSSPVFDIPANQIPDEVPLRKFDDAVKEAEGVKNPGKDGKGITYIRYAGD